MKGRLIAAVFFLLASGTAIGQGCSDAGFCTLNSLKPDTEHPYTKESVIKQRNNQVKLGVAFGTADHSIRVFSQYLEYNRRLNRKLGLDIKLTGLSQAGNGYSAYNIGDVFINANYAVAARSTIIAGLKIPTNAGNYSEGGLSLPMDYQSSLGTLDLILGCSYETHNIQLVLALQQPLSQNKNGFLAELYPTNHVFTLFQSTNRFERSGDVLLRVSYPFKAGKKLVLTPSLLPIYHLADDSYKALNGSNEIVIAGSRGLTLNATAYADYQLSSRSSLQFNAGTPLIYRKARPDGLTRHLVLSLEYRVNF